MNPAKILLFFMLLVISFSLSAEAKKWQIDPVKSSLTFTATQNQAPVSGQFKKFSGDIVVDPNNLKNSHIEIVVDMNSVSTSYADLREALTTADWFDVA